MCVYVWMGQLAGWHWHFEHSKAALNPLTHVTTTPRGQHFPTVPAPTSSKCVNLARVLRLCVASFESAQCLACGGEGRMCHVALVVPLRAIAADCPVADGGSPSFPGFAMQPPGCWLSSLFILLLYV